MDTFGTSFILSSFWYFWIVHNARVNCHKGRWASYGMGYIDGVKVLISCQCTDFDVIEDSCAMGSLAG